LRERYPEVIWAAHGPAEYVRVWLGAMQCLADAETARARRDPDETSRWHAAAEACRNAMVPWDEAYARWREAQSALRGRIDRNQGVAALRRAQELALDLQANPLLAEIDILAKNMHLPPAAPKPPAATATIPGLTTREREVLIHLTAGETYSEIARALVLSEKTISAHVSNMLRKTGTRSRVDLVEYARRLESKEAAARI
jgi:DNA-binding CsgD family transcriptional regulator